MSVKITYSKIAKYLAGECSPEEKWEIEKLLENSKEDREFFKQVESIWDAGTHQSRDWDTDAEWEKLMNRKRAEEKIHPLAASYNHIGLKQHSDQRRFTGARLVKAASIIFLSFSLLYLFTDKWITDDDSFGMAGYKEVTTLDGQNMKIRLSDGSKVMLNARSTIIFPEKYPSENRGIFLDGEAYFQVTNDQANPFIVKTENVKIEVLGTEFNVNTWVIENGTQVAVTSGKVSMSSFNSEIDDRVIIEPGQLGEWNKIIGMNRPKIVDTDEFIAWTWGELVFNGTPLDLVIERIERRYNLNIVVDNNLLLTRRITARFKDEPVEEVLSVIALSLGVSIEQDEEDYRILE